MTSPTSSNHKPAGIPVPSSTSSFWHSEPSEFLLGHRTTSELPKTVDYCIIGSGITGSSCARFLAEDERTKGKSILMLEAREACWGATGRNGGHCQVLPVARSMDVTQFEVDNYETVKSYIAEHNVECEWRSLDGCRAYYSSDMFKVAETEVSELKKHSGELGKLVNAVTDKEELAKLRVSKAVGATLCSAAASLWPYKLVSFVLEKLVKEGKLNLQTNTPVEMISDLGIGPAVRIHTSRDVIFANHVILATNGYTSHLLPEFADLIVPVRGEMSSLLPPKGSERLEASYGLCGQPGQPSHGDDYLNQRPFEGVPNPAGHFMFGGGDGEAKHERIGVWDDSIVDEGMAAWLRRKLLEAMDIGGETEGLKELEATHQWSGIMGYSRDNLPWVGCVPHRGNYVWLAGGYTGHGMPNGTLCGKAVAKMVLATEAAGLAYTPEVEDHAVKESGLPRGYLISEDRMNKARKLPTVAAAEAMGAIGNHARQEGKTVWKGMLDYVTSFVWGRS
ncbi:DAO-domain-containing protein [Saccharata proteae CBS 121410]|uniref:DAO-domain-containing protein n=1 Tax=Saccharata proteae CBS 121410 TaxID=1314787 RepID=A0A9P4HPK3_9PEZI|nr:DAO-domain-containing protein [Saccharata proteae CBS 121410]